MNITLQQSPDAKQQMSWLGYVEEGVWKLWPRFRIIRFPLG